MPLKTIDSSSGLPKYKQIVNSIISAIDNNELKVGDKIPSVNEVSHDTGFAKKTVVQAFEQLKEYGLITAVKYKGYFIASSETQVSHNIFVLFNNLTAYKEEIYEGIKSSLADKGVVDIYFHHDKLDVFETLIEKSAGKYTEYIIMPVDNPKISASLGKLPKDKVYILDLGFADWGQRYPSVCQDFEGDIYDALEEGLERVLKYKKLILVSGPNAYNLRFTEKGFLQFCNTRSLEHEIITSSKERIPQQGELYIVIKDNDLVDLVKKANSHSLKLGKDMGIISYNETPFKEIVANGIATISTDFSKMGRSIVDLLLEKKKEHLRNPSRLILRDSL